MDSLILQGVSTLPLVAASYSLNGSFIGLEDVSDQILLCRDPQPRGGAVWRVGVQYNIQVVNVFNSVCFP